jgi:integrase
MLAEARRRATTPKWERDLALIRLMHDLGLRRGEVVTLDLADVDLDAGTVAVVGKGKSERMPVSTSPAIPTPAPPTSTTAPSRRSAARSSIRSRTDRAAARHPDVVW